MDFFSQIGTQEILMILLVAIIVIGPNKIVEFGQSAGKMTRNLKKVTTDMTINLEKELEEDKKKDAKASPPVKKS
jgi:Sec-independent protein translocase protein TatA